MIREKYIKVQIKCGARKRVSIRNSKVPLLDGLRHYRRNYHRDQPSHDSSMRSCAADVQEE